MTREQRLEEMLHHAHERGYYEQVIKKAKAVKDVRKSIFGSEEGN